MMLLAEEIAIRVPDATRMRGECPKTCLWQVNGVEQIEQEIAYLREEQ